MRSILTSRIEACERIGLSDIRQGSMNLCDSIESDRREGVAELAVRLFRRHRTLVSRFREEGNETGMCIERSEEECSKDHGNHQAHEMIIILTDWAGQ